MSGLKQELGLAQGVGLLSTSLLGTGVFAAALPIRPRFGEKRGGTDTGD